MKPGDQVEVIWYDTATDDEWKNESDPDLELIEASTIGYFRKRDKRAVYVVSTITMDGDRFGSVTIPRGCIRKIVRLG